MHTRIEHEMQQQRFALSQNIWDYRPVTKINFYTIVGTLVKSEMLKQNNRQINFGDLSHGVYMVTIKSKDLTENQRLIIQR